MSSAGEAGAGTAIAFRVLTGLHHDYDWVAAQVVLAKERAYERGGQRRSFR